MTNELEQFIDNALNQDVELTRKEYREKCEQADATAEAHDVEGEAPLTEVERHARIQTNFYGTVLNFLASILCEVSETNRLLMQLIAKEGDNDAKQ